MVDDGWRRIWEERGREYPGDEPALIAGYDQAYSALSTEGMNALAEDIATKLALEAADSLLDIGCGAGLLLDRLASRVAAACGIDYAESMVQRAHRIFPHLQVRQGEARALPFADASVDKVLMHGVALYFPDGAHLIEALDEAVRVCRHPGRVLIGDIPDAAKRDESLRTRARLASLAPPPWTSSVTTAVSHLYLTREFFDRYAADRGIGCINLDRRVTGYVNAVFRFDSLLTLP